MLKEPFSPCAVALSPTDRTTASTGSSVTVRVPHVNVGFIACPDGSEITTSSRHAVAEPAEVPATPTVIIGPSPGAIRSPVRLNPTTIPLLVDTLKPSVLSVVDTETTSPISGLNPNVNWNPATGSSLDILTSNSPSCPNDNDKFPTDRATGFGGDEAVAQSSLEVLDSPSS